MTSSVAKGAAPPTLALSREPAGALVVKLAGNWHVGGATPPARQVSGEIEEAAPAQLRFDTTELTGWDSSLVALAAHVTEIARAHGVPVDRSGLPAGAQRLLALFDATPAQPRAARLPPSRVARIGLRTLGIGSAIRESVTCVGALSIAFVKLLVGRAKLRRSDLWLQMQEAGASALGIVSLVTGLVGFILAFISAVQLAAFGATLYVADLVAIAMVRELGAMMAAIVVAGRTGAAFAAELGTMKVTQELDAYDTLGLAPVEFLVLPRVLAVTLMMPVLCIYADLLGILGGAAVGIGVMHVAPRLYIDQTIAAVSLTDLFGGLVKATTYGLLIGMAGCFIGLRTGRTAAAVGRAATSAVVAGIVLVITSCATYAVAFYILEI